MKSIRAYWKGLLVCALFPLITGCNTKVGQFIHEQTEADGYDT